MKTGLLAMVGDLFHPGHVSAIKEARKLCSHLIVALNVDPTDVKGAQKPIQSVFERWMQIASCKYVDEVIPYSGEQDLLRLLQMTDYDIRFVWHGAYEQWTGKEYEAIHGIESEVVTRYCGDNTGFLDDRVEISEKTQSKQAPQNQLDEFSQDVLDSVVITTFLTDHGDVDFCVDAMTTASNLARKGYGKCHAPDDAKVEYINNKRKGRSGKSD